MTTKKNTDRNRLQQAIEAIYGKSSGKWYVYRNPRTGKAFISNRRACKCLEILGVYDSHEQARQRAQEADLDLDEAHREHKDDLRTFAGIKTQTEK